MENKFTDYDNRFEEIFDALQKDKEVEFKQKIFYKGQIYDAYQLIIDIIKQANRKIVIIDNYIDDSVLKMLQKKNKNVEIKKGEDSKEIEVKSGKNYMTCLL